MASGKGGITGLAINEGKISLVYFYDEGKVKKSLKHRYEATLRLGDRRNFKAVIKSEYLPYIFFRVRLLAH